MKKFILAGILSVSSLACATPGLPTSYTVQIDDSFSAQEIAIIESAMSSWTSLSTDAPTFDFQITPAFSEYHVDQVPWGDIVLKKDTLKFIQSVSGNSSDTVAYTSTSSVLCHVENGTFNLNPKTIGATVYLPALEDMSSLVPSNPNGAYFMTIAHESGHAMGLHHTGQGTIMNPSLYGAAGKPTCADLTQYCSDRPGLKCECTE